MADENLGSNPSGDPGANTSQQDNGTTVQTFDDGSTLTTNPDGTTSSTPAPSDTTSVSGLQNALDTANSKYLSAIQKATDAETAVQAAEDALDTAQTANPVDEQAVADAQATLDVARANLTDAQNAVHDASGAVDTAQSALDNATNPSSDANTTNPSSTDLSGGKGSIDALSGIKNAVSLAGTAVSGAATSAFNSVKSLFSNPAGRTPLNSVPTRAVAAVAGFGSGQDMRVKLRVPANYLVGPAAGPSGALSLLGGILFPYTPQVSVSNQATYNQNKVTHSNYQFYNYQSSSVGPISVNGKFTAQNEYEAAIILSVQHLLRALTKMKFGDDQNAGAPPPICRLDAFGDYQFKNVPVTVADFKIDLPDGVDYIAVGRGIAGYGNTMVPTSCTISMTLNIMYSRQEMMNYGVDKWLAGSLQGKGYL